MTIYHPFALQCPLVKHSIFCLDLETKSGVILRFQERAEESVVKEKRITNKRN